jgi:methyl-accepting chemotaxis protein
MGAIRISNWTIARKLTVFGAFVVVIALIGTASTLYDKRESMLSAKREQTRNLVEVAHGILAQSYGLEQSGELKREQAQQRAIQLLRTLRYDQKEYFWINDMHPRMVMHPFKPELDGQDLSDNADPNGKKLFIAFVDAVKRSGAGYVDYMWPKPGVAEPVDKVSYVKGFQPWGWVIGSGIYIDDVNTRFWADTTRLGAVGALLMALLFIPPVLMTRALVRALGGEPAAATAVATRVSAGDFSRDVPLRAGDGTSLMASMAKMQADLKVRLEADAKTAAEMLRVKHALDRVTSCVMIADTAGKIIYMNDSVKKMFHEDETDIRKDMPQFKAAAVVGSSVNQFHKNMRLQEDVLSGLTQMHKTSIKVGGHSFNLTTLPVIDEHKQRLGTVVEWVERTADVAAQAEVEELVRAANDGDFSKRIVVEGKEGFLKLLAEGINALMQTSSVGLSEVARVLAALARGDLTEKITNDYKGTFGQLKDDANLTAAKLTQIMGQIKEATESINVASKEIASGNTDLSSRTETQAASLEKTALSMGELTSTVRKNAESAQQANQLAAGASVVAMKGGDVVGQVVTTMNSINESSKRIVDIISVIDGIAFQTNILALNAAVEAARAGEQGRGFAVVATEVRTLAQRSAAAAKEIKELIDDSVQKVGAGTKLVDEAGDTMQKIVASVKRVTDIMAEITAASQEQSAGIEQVSAAITQMDEVTQQNAALVEEAAAAAESMEEQAGNLAQAVAIFKLAQTGGSTRSTASRASGAAGPRAPHKLAGAVPHASAAV